MLPHSGRPSHGLLGPSGYPSAQFGRTPRAVRQLLQDVVRHLVIAILQQMRDTVWQGLLKPGEIPPPRLPLLLDLGQGRPRVKHADAGQELVVRQLGGSGT